MISSKFVLSIRSIARGYNDKPTVFFSSCRLKAWQLNIILFDKSYIFLPLVCLVELTPR